MGRIGRMATGIACMICAAWGAFSYVDGEIPFEPVITFITLFVAWAFTEFNDNSPKDGSKEQLHPHDAELAMKLRTLLDESMKRYLREHSFGETFRYGRLEHIRILASWVGPEYEFENTELDNLASEVVHLSRELDDKIGEYGNPLEHRSEYWTLAPDDERSSDYYSRETFSKIGEVNMIAQALVEAGDTFEKAFRKLSPENYRRDN